MGVRVKASSKERKTATVTVMPYWKKNLPTTPCIKITGIKMAAMAMVANQLMNLDEVLNK